MKPQKLFESMKMHDSIDSINNENTKREIVNNFNFKTIETDFLSTKYTLAIFILNLHVKNPHNIFKLFKKKNVEL